jgi:hypothetical protein
MRLPAEPSQPTKYPHLDFAPRPTPSIIVMTTIISDDEVFMYAERAKGKVVVLTGT